MSGGSSTDRSALERDGFEPQPFLSTHRAHAACSRELGRLMDEVIDRVGALAPGGIAEKPVVRQSPERCIVQLGPVALTLVWLRGGMESVAAGELLVIVWKGIVARPNSFQPERSGASGGMHAAKSLWEQVLRPTAATEAEWSWHVVKGEAQGAGCTSIELAARCVEQLREAYAAAV
ncbi:MAG: hypothetical protein HOQ11_14835 [Gemmatimonadaceae bacterium]|nr:hypothetical protein [Gemmatimonadaceae bacterium]NUQ94590.1 hypothetical protein [Gemmatimonadaceae bacterium]NUR19002.1 hypothetical protein [Gemmatimonadaceae bacterium]NUS98675.1 hypothetical protein [Gemmatimonadaceae bacterium]